MGEHDDRIDFAAARRKVADCRGAASAALRPVPRGGQHAVAGRAGAGAHRGSVLVIVMMSLLFATFALIAFMERASNDLLVDQREALTRRMRLEAYSALEVTLAVLEQFRSVGNGLRSPAEGWSDPLAFAGYTPGEDRQVVVTFEDESGKISLPHADAGVLTNLFKNWQINEADAEAMADALIGWMKKGHTYGALTAPRYEQAAIPYVEPARPMRSYHELAAIEKAREIFYDAEGRPTELWKRFTESVSLLDFRQPNVNAARPDTLAAVGQFDPMQQQTLGDYLAGTGAFLGQGPGFFQNPTDAQAIAGPTGNTAAFGTTISALRVNVTVIEGRTQFTLATVIAPPNGARIVQTNATSQRAESSASAARTAKQQQNRPNPMQRNTPPVAGSTKTQQDRNLQYPFTLLEISENAEIAPGPPPPARDPLI